MAEKTDWRDWLILAIILLLLFMMKSKVMTKLSAMISGILGKVVTSVAPWMVTAVIVIIVASLVATLIWLMNDNPDWMADISNSVGDAVSSIGNKTGEALGETVMGFFGSAWPLIAFGTGGFLLYSWLTPKPKSLRLGGSTTVVEKGHALKMDHTATRVASTKTAKGGSSD